MANPTDLTHKEYDIYVGSMNTKTWGYNPKPTMHFGEKLFALQLPRIKQSTVLYKGVVKNGLPEHHGKHARWMRLATIQIEWVSCQAVKCRWLVQAQGAPAELGLGSHLLWGWALGLLYSACRWVYWCTPPPRQGARTGMCTQLQRTPLPLMVPQLLQMGCWWLMVGPFSTDSSPAGFMVQFPQTWVEAMGACG